MIEDANEFARRSHVNLRHLFRRCVCAALPQSFPFLHIFMHNWTSSRAALKRDPFKSQITFVSVFIRRQRLRRAAIGPLSRTPSEIRSGRTCCRSWRRAQQGQRRPSKGAELLGPWSRNKCLVLVISVMKNKSGNFQISLVEQRWWAAVLQNRRTYGQLHSVYETMHDS